jgi:acetyl esterase/lipase
MHAKSKTKGRQLAKSTFTLLMLTGCIALAGKLSAQQFIPLWEPGHMPDSKGLHLKDSIVNERYYQVGTPGMYVFRPAKEVNTGTAVLICPGGGYTHITYQLGGFSRAKWLNVMGVTAFVLIYRLPNSPDLAERAKGPLQDAQRAMRIIRAGAGKWGIDPGRIGVMGASAGGHIAACLGTFTSDFSSVGDSLDKFSFRPDFMVLVSPVISMGKYAHRGSRKSLLGDHPSTAMEEKYSAELQVTDATPPCFIADAFNDRTVDPHNSLLFYQALLGDHVSTSFHVFPQGGHSIGMTDNPGSTKYWMALCKSWLKEMKFIVPVK